MVRYSRRVPRSLELNRVSVARARLGAVDCDLTDSNPTRCGLPYPPDLVAALAHPAAARYAPDPRGDGAARTAVAQLYRRWRVEPEPEQVVLTASTSEAYGFLFKLLADPGDAVLVPTPSYPLFEQLTRLEGVVARPYRLAAEDGWRIDPAGLVDASDDVRAVVVVHPNNPTGSFVHPDDVRAVTGLAAARGWAVIADEVFLPYVLEPAAGSDTSLAAGQPCLSFALGGLSKLAGLPQMKLAWIVASGPDTLVEEALGRLDHVTDAYLPVSAPVAAAAPRLLEATATVERAILDRCRANLSELERQAGAFPAVSVLRPAGGWSAILRIPSVLDEEELTLELLAADSVAVHPGYYFDLPGEGYLVLSLLPPTGTFAAGVERLLARVMSLLGV